MLVEEVTSGDELWSLEREWRGIFDATPTATPFQSWEWISAWWRHHGRGRPWVLLAREGERLVGVMPLTVTNYRRTGLRQLRFMGAPLSDYQDLLGPVERQAECARAFFAHLEARRDRWELCDLNDLPAGSAALVEGAGGLRAEAVFHRKCPRIALCASWEAFLAGMRRKLRSNVNRRFRLAAAAHRVELDTVSDERLLPEAMEELFRLHNGRWRRRGLQGAFSGEAIQRFHHEVAARFLARGWLRLHRLRFDGETVASFYCFQDRARVYYYLGGFDVAHHRLGPGQLLMAYAIQRAIAEGARELDLLRGDESYKYEWGAVDRATTRRVLGHEAWRSRVGLRLHRWERYWEHKGLAWQRRLWGGAEDPHERRQHQEGRRQAA